MASAVYNVPIPVPVNGVHPELKPEDVGPSGLVEAENWLLRDGHFGVRPGNLAFANNGGGRTVGLIQYPHTDGIPRIVRGTTIGWSYLDPGTNTWTNLTAGAALTGGPKDQQIFRVFQKGGTSWLLGTNGKDVMQKWDGVAVFRQDVGGSPPICLTFMPLFSRIISGNLRSGGTVSPVAIDVSGFNDFDSGWGTVLVGLLADTPGAIVAMQELGDLQGAIYKTDAIVLAFAQAGLAPFRFEWKIIGIAGPASPLSVFAVTEGLHIYLASDGSVMQFDGTAVRSLGRHLQKHVQKTANLTAMQGAWAFYDQERREAWFGYPAIGSANSENNVGMIVNLDNEQLWPMRWDALRMSAGRRFPIASGFTIGQLVGTISQQTGTIGDYTTSQAKTLLADINGQLFEDRGTLDNNQPISNFFETGLSDLSDSDSTIGPRWKTIQEIDHLTTPTPAGVTDTDTLNVSLRTTDYGEDGDLSDPQPLLPGAEGRKITEHRVSGRAFGVRMTGATRSAVEWIGGAASVKARGTR